MNYYGFTITEGTWCIKTNAPYNYVMQAVCYANRMDKDKWWENLNNHLSDNGWIVDDVEIEFICPEGITDTEEMYTLGEY